MDEREQRIVANEALFREVNERVQELQTSFGGGANDQLAAVCECGDERCTERLSLDYAAYEKLRSNPATFAVVPGHEVPDVEHVVARHGSYLVVEKAPEAARLAAELDSRSP